MSERELRRRYRDLLRSLDIEPPLVVAELCRRLGEARGKPIHLVAHSIPEPGPFGAWITGPRAEYIFYQRHTSPMHQNHIILHELGHLLEGHSGVDHDDVLVAEFSPDSAEQSLRAKYPDIPLDAVRQARRRGAHADAYNTAEEHDAETVATIILEWASVLDATNSRSSSGWARGMDTALGDRLGWL